MPIPPGSRCPGSGRQMVSRTYIIRHIEPADRDKHVWSVARAEERGDLDEVEIIKRHFFEWEQEQGQMREKLVCAVCGDAWLTPTARGTARPHVRRDIDQPSWGRIRQLRDDIKTLEAELDRLLQALEPD